MTRYWTWIGGVVFLAAFGFVVFARPTETAVPLLGAAFGAALVTQDDRLKRYAARFPRWLGVLLMAGGFALAYFGGRTFGPDNYALIMGGAMSLLLARWVLLRRGA